MMVEGGKMRTAMKTKLGIGMGTMAACTALLVASATAQSAAPAPLAPAPAMEVVRVIDDHATGVRWLLLRDPSHPGGPGRMVRSTEFQGNAPGNSIAAAAAQGGTSLAPAAVHPLIRMGDRLIVEEHSAVADANLEGVALTAANLGSPLEVRLRIGGRTLRALATGPGRATLEPEVRP